MTETNENLTAKEVYRRMLERIAESDCDCAVASLAREALDEGRDLEVGPPIPCFPFQTK